MDAVPKFLDEMARRLVPGCDPAVVQAVFARASAGYTGPRGRDGLRVTAISPSGVPFEASVTGGAGRSAATLRYVTETATGMPFFGPRLAVQRAALDDLVGWLPPAAQEAASELRGAVDVLFPDPGAVPARRRFATTFGIAHRDEVPDGIAGLKLYGNLRTGDHEDAAATAAAALGRLCGRSPTLAGLRHLVDDLRYLDPHFMTVEVDGKGRTAHKLYLRTRRAKAAGLAVAARRVGAELGPVADALSEAGVDDGVWRRRFFVCVASRPVGTVDDAGGRGDCELSVHLSARALRLDRAGMARLARTLVERHGDPAGLDALDAAAARAGGDGCWTTTVVGLGLATGAVGKVNVYTSTDGEAIVRG